MTIEFTVDHDETVIADGGEDQLIGDISFTLDTRPGAFRVGDYSGPTPRTLNLPRRIAYLAADGHLYKDSSADEPFRLPANDPEWNLLHLTYRVDFNLTDLLGNPYPIPLTYMAAPSTDTTAYLTRYIRTPSQVVMEVRAKNYAEDIIDAGAAGMAAIQANTAAELRAAAGLDLIDLDEWEFFDELADFPAIGTADVVYGALDTGALYRWNGSAYVIATQDIAPRTHAAAIKATPIENDEVPLVDTAASNVLKRLPLKNLQVMYRRARSFDASNATDDTTALQAALAEGAREYVFRSGGTWIVDANTTTGMLEPLSNSRIIIEEGATVTVKTNALSEYHLFHLDGVENVTIEGAGTLQGDALVHTGTTGQYGHLIYITNGSSDIQIVGPLRGREAWGDFIYIGGGLTAVNHDVLIDGAIADDCRREGFSPFWVDGCTIRNYRINGGPAALVEPVLGNGIDVEPNDGQWVTDLTIEQGVIEDLIGNGIYASPLPAGGTAPYIRNFKIYRPRVIGCGQDPTVPGHGNNIYIKNTDDLLLVDPYTADVGTVGDALACNVKLSGITGARVKGGQVEASSGEGFYATLCPNLDASGMSVRDNQRRGAHVDQSDGAKVYSNEFTGNLLDDVAGSGHLRFTNCDRGRATQNTFEGDQGGAWVSVDASCSDMFVRNNEGFGDAPTAMLLDLGTNTRQRANYRIDTGVYEPWTTADDADDPSYTTHAAASKTTPVDADEIPLVDSAASNALKRLTWANLKATLASWLGLLPSGTAVAIHNQADQTTNYERVREFFSSNVAQLMTEQGGTGTFRDLRVGVGGAHYANFSITNPKVLLSTGGGGVAGAMTQIATGTLTGASVAQTGLKVTSTVNQTGTSSYITLEIDITETATGSGTKRPISVKRGGVEQFAVDNTGAIAVGGGIVRVFNVKDPTYGALGNNSANDTTAIQNAINAANTAGGGVVYFPPGIYRHTGLTMPTGGGVSLEGVNRLVSILRNTHASNHSITMHSATPGSVFNNDYAIRNLRIDATAVNAGQRGLSLDSTVLWEVKGVSITNHGIGINHALSWGGTYRDIYIEDCTTGFYCTSSAAGCPLTFFNLNIYECTTGFHINDGAAGWSVFGGTIALCTTGLIVDGQATQQVGFHGIDFEDNSGDDIIIGGASTTPQGVLFNNCGFQWHTGSARSIWYQRGDAVTFNGATRWWGTGTVTTAIQQDATAGTLDVCGTMSFLNVTNWLTKWDGSYPPHYQVTHYSANGSENGIFRSGNGVSALPQITNITSSATPTFNTDKCDFLNITAQAAAITSMTSGVTGTPVNGQRLGMRIKDNGTARAITWGSLWASSGTATLLATTAISKAHEMEFVYNSVTAKWVCVRVDSVGY